jgi:hypothetical protein
MTIVLTNCTNRKRGLISPGLTSESLDRGSIDTVAKQWLDRLINAPAENIARETYCGRSFRDAEASATSLKCSLYVVSAGLGIVNSEQKVPVYSLTVSSESTNSIWSKVSDHKSSNAWWSKMVKGNPFGSSLIDTLELHPDDLILLALSRPYIELLQDELLNCSPQQQQRLRFFGKKLNSALPTSLVGNWMPYDDRLDCAGQDFSGTQSDFAQRALRHFVTEVLNMHQNGDASTHYSAVLELLSPFNRREIPKRQRLSDEEISTAIHNNWERGKGQSSTLLRIIRRELGIACEQSRFRTIYHTVKNTMESTRQ